MILQDLSWIRQSGFHLFWFHNNNFFKQGLQSYVQPQNLEDQVSVFKPPSDRVAQLYIQAQGSLFVAYYDSQGHRVVEQLMGLN
jgi:hypothetical protein